METVETKDYRVHGPWLHVLRRHLEPQLIYWGHGLRPSGLGGQKGAGLAHHWIRLEFDRDDLKTLSAATERTGPWRVLDHKFHRTRTIFADTPREAQVVITAARSDREHDEAMALVARRHYLNPRPGGVHLIARLSGTKTAGSIIACLTLERLTHGSPHGRCEIYGRLGLEPPTKAQRRAKGFRKQELHRLGLAWISRVAVHERYEGSGLATAMCDVACEAAPRLMADSANWLELLRKVPGKKFAGLIKGEDSDFLVGAGQQRSGFTLMPHELSSRPGLDMDAKSGLRLPRDTGATFDVPAATGGTRIIQGDRDYMAYYYAKTRP